MQLVTKLDECGTHGNSPFMTMAGYAARLGQWQDFDRRWKREIDRAGLSYFHAKEHYAHSFSTVAHQIADGRLMFGIVVRLDRADYEKHYREGGWGGKRQPDSMYGLCFRYCLSFVLQQALTELPRRDLVLNFIVEDGHANAGAPTEILRQLKRKNLPDVSEFLGSAVPAEKTKIYGLQAADGLAYGAWQEENAGIANYGPPEAQSGVRLRAARRRSPLRTPLFRCHIDASELASFKGDYFAHIDYRAQWGKQKPRAAVG